MNLHPVNANVVPQRMERASLNARSVSRILMHRNDLHLRTCCSRTRSGRRWSNNTTVYHIMKSWVRLRRSGRKCLMIKRRYVHVPMSFFVFFPLLACATRFACETRTQHHCHCLACRKPIPNKELLCSLRLCTRNCKHTYLTFANETHLCSMATNDVFIYVSDIGELTQTNLPSAQVYNDATKKAKREYEASKAAYEQRKRELAGEQVWCASHGILSQCLILY